MKTLKLLMMVLFLMGMTDQTSAQDNKKILKPESKLKINKPLGTKEIKKAYTPVQTSKVTVGTIKPREDMCKPLNLLRTEEILKEKIGRTMNLKLDKDYSSIMVIDQRIPLEFGFYKVNKAGNDWTYYLNDINSRMVRIKYKEGNYQLLIEFESDNTEMKGICHGCRVGDKDRRAPDINWENPALLIVLEPSAHNNSLILKPINVQVLGKYEFNGLTDAFFPSITTFFKNKLERIVREKLTVVFNSNDVKNLISSALKPEVDALGIGPVKNVDLSESQLFLCNY